MKCEKHPNFPPANDLAKIFPTLENQALKYAKEELYMARLVVNNRADYQEIYHDFRVK